MESRRFDTLEATLVDELTATVDELEPTEALDATSTGPRSSDSATRWCAASLFRSADIITSSGTDKLFQS